MAKLTKLKRSPDPYLKGRTRMPFEIPPNPKKVSETLRNVVGEEFGQQKRIKEMSNKDLGKQAKPAKPARSPSDFDKKITRGQYPQRMKKGK